MSGQSHLFSCGMDLANLAIGSDLLRPSWNANLDLLKGGGDAADPPLSARYRVDKYPKPGGVGDVTVVAFGSSPVCSARHLQELGVDFVSSQELKDSSSTPSFDFVCTKLTPAFSVHRASIALFASVYDQLCVLKRQLGDSSQLIITGHSIGGSIASLFTLCILDSISPNAKRPLCITFGSPLLGDGNFQRAIMERPAWNSCFLHVVSDKDPVPRLFSAGNLTCDLKPFGTFLLCSGLSCSSFEEPESVSQLLKAMSSGNDGHGASDQIIDYGLIMEHLSLDGLLVKGTCRLDGSVIDPLQAGILIQMNAAGIEVGNISSDFKKGIEKSVREFLISKRKVLFPKKKLNDIKIDMTYLEWYKKITAEEGGYYDSYRDGTSKSRDEIRSKQEIVKHHRMLTQYWKRMVEEVEKMPQKEGAVFRISWLYAGTNYRRMVEPLDIADYYSKGNKDYLNQGRSRHYILLEKWFIEDQIAVATKQSRVAKKRDKAVSLTEDSQFWARVEDAILSCESLKNGQGSAAHRESIIDNLRGLEDYVFKAITDYSVSPEIFHLKSSFMRWWKEYQKIVGGTDTPLANYMKGQYRQYA